MTTPVRYHEPRSDGVKSCRRCKRELPRVQFGVRRRNSDGRLNICHECEYERHSRAKHGLNRQEKAAIAKTQGGCLICPRQAPGWHGWVVDHDRSCCPGDKSCPKCRRGVICTWCNSAMGYAMDSPALLRAMADYLDAHANGTSQAHLRAVHPGGTSTEKDGRDGRTNGESAFCSRENLTAVTRGGCG